jgi:hypothetical protein
MKFTGTLVSTELDTYQKQTRVNVYRIADDEGNVHGELLLHGKTGLLSDNSSEGSALAKNLASLTILFDTNEEVNAVSVEPKPPSEETVELATETLNEETKG